MQSTHWATGGRQLKEVQKPGFRQRGLWLNSAVHSRRGTGVMGLRGGTLEQGSSTGQNRAGRGTVLSDILARDPGVLTSARPFLC